MLRPPKPHFLLIGAQKCGTSSLYRYLTCHLLVNPAARKELHYFDLNYTNGHRWYRRQFHFEKNKITGESTPYYLAHPAVPGRVKAYHPDIKLIAILRHPVERALSHYRMNCERGVEPLPLRQALEAEEERLAQAYDPEDPQNPHLVYSYLLRGRYPEQLQRWRQHFPPEQLLLLNFDQFFRDPWREVQAVYSFLGLPPYYGSGQKFRENVTSPREEVSETDRQFLQEYYAPTLKRMAEDYNLYFER